MLCCSVCNKLSEVKLRTDVTVKVPTKDNPVEYKATSMMVMTTGIIHTLLLGLLIIESVYAIAGMFKFFGRASPVSPSSSDTDDNGYYERFPLDYGCDDNIRIAGSMKGFIRTGRLSGLHESDPFFKWLNEKLEKGPEVPSNRVKPYYVSLQFVICSTYSRQV